MRASCKLRRIKTTTREATHLDANGAPIESACMPSIVGEVDHLGCLTPALADHLVSRHTRPAQFEPSDGALVTPLGVVQHQEIGARTATAREIGGRSPEKRRGKLRHPQNPPLQQVRLVPEIEMVHFAERVPLTRSARSLAIFPTVSSADFVQLCADECAEFAPTQLRSVMEAGLRQGKAVNTRVLIT